MDKYFTPIFIFAVLANILAFWIKYILKENNYKISYFSGYFRDTKNIFKLVNLTSDKGRKTKYFIIGLTEVLAGIGFIISFIFLISSVVKTVSNAPCDRFNEFKDYKYDYLILNKYLDTTQHSYPTLILQDATGNKFVNQDLILDRSELFDFLTIGDSIKKQQGTVLVNIINSKTDTTFEVDFGCDKK
jgi:hypothetical protein